MAVAVLGGAGEAGGRDVPPLLELRWLRIVRVTGRRVFAVLLGLRLLLELRPPLLPLAFGRAGLSRPGP